MAFFRKKAVVVEAMRFEYTAEGIARLNEFAKENIGRVSKDRYPGAKAEAYIRTLEDGKHLVVKHVATEGDWIIKGVEGEFYACKPEIFDKTYELVEESTNDTLHGNEGKG